MIRLEQLRGKSWPIVCAALLLFFAGTRLYDLGARPLHHDEGVNGVFLKNLSVDNRWSYDPANYHGPTLYYFQLIPTWIWSYVRDGAASFDRRSVSGIDAVSVRFTIAVAGIVLLAMILGAWPLLGRVGAAAACILAGISVDIHFISRYFIHEIYVLIFTWGTIFAAYRYRATREAVYAYLCALSATLLFCTKETAVFHLIILALAFLCVEFVLWLSSGRQARLDLRGIAAAPSRIVKELGTHASIITLLCVVVWAVLFSSFFSNWRGPIDSFNSFRFWGAEGMESGHEKPFFYYFAKILVRYEAVVLIFGFIGMIAAFAKGERKGLFLAFWTLGMAGFYSVVPYKTPWLVVNIVLPITLVGGYGVQVFVDAVRERLPRPHALVTLVATGAIALFLAVAELHQSWKVVFVEYDSDRHPQVYAHTLREIRTVNSKIEAVASRMAPDKKMQINVYSDVYWPIPMYLLPYDAKFWGSRVDEATLRDGPVLIVQPKLRDQVDRRLKDIYTVKEFLLRPGVPLLLYVNTAASDSTAVTMRPLDLLTTQLRPANLKPGLAMTAYRGVNFSGKAMAEVSGDWSFDFDWVTNSQKRYQPPFSLKWKGFIDIAKAGEYRFALESDDGSWLTIDDTPVIDNGGDHAAIKISRPVNLSAGLHKIELKYYDVLGGAVLRFTWAPPGEKETIVPANVLYYRP